MEKKPACVMCGSNSLRLDESEKTIDIEGIAIKVLFRKHWCESCGSVMGLNEDLRFNARAMRQARKKHYGLLTGEEVRKIRKQLGLSQEQAARLFGGGPVAFSKYENDEISQSESMDRLIRIAAAHPELLPTLAALGHLEMQAGLNVQGELTNIRFDERVFAQVEQIFEARDVTPQGFDDIYSASNDALYDSGQSPKPVKWSTA